MSHSVSDRQGIKYVKHNTARLKAGKREASTKLLLEFFNKLEGKVKGMKGFLVMDNMKDTQESIVLTFWETKEDMDAFYNPDNKTLANFVETAKSAFEQMPERNDYQISSIEIYI
jgi:heme-degrading monooxygenase HmoA